MPFDLSRHPSNIARAAAEFLATVKLPAGALQSWRNIIELFVECLQSDPSAVIEGCDGNGLLRNNWADYSGKVMSDFVECWLPASALDGSTQDRAARILNDWIRWCYDHNFFDKDCRDAFLSALPEQNNLEIRRLQRAAELLFLLHTPLPDAWKTGEYDKVVCIQRNNQPEDRKEGFMKIRSLGNESGVLEDPQGAEIGPVLIGKALAKIFKVGDVIDVAIGRYGNCWQVLDSGQVYAEDLVKPGDA